jgi:uncharacterized protein
MQLTRDQPEGYLFLRSCGSDGAVVVDRRVTRSFALAPDRILEDWPVASVDALDEEHLTALLALEPELVLLGTGTVQRFPDRQLLLPLLRRGVGVEIMDNAAAARTYNLLVAEGRRAVAALIFPPAP